jgi:hypothetical protein
MTTEDQVSGMTVNERLAHFGLLGSFDAAVESRRLEVVVTVLCRAHFTEAQARETASTILANPALYGFR